MIFCSDIKTNETASCKWMDSSLHGAAFYGKIRKAEMKTLIFNGLPRKKGETAYIVIASPVYFEEVTGMLLAVLSRLQTYFSARYLRKEEPVPKKKTGAVLLAAGSIGPREKAESTAEMLLRQMSCDSLGTVYVNRTDKVPVRDREDIIQEIEELAEKLR